MNNRHLQLSLALALALGAGQAQALGLGAIEVKSGLNQPLLAEIPILSAAPGELEELEVRLASPEAFARVGLDRPVGLAANLQMEVGRNAQGQPVIRVTTPGRFNEPVLTFLLEANWGRGSVVREFSALVDPPYIAPAVIRPLETPTVSPAPLPPPAEPVALPEAEPAPVAEVPPAPAPEPEPAPVAPAAPTGEAVAMPAAPEPAPAPAAEPLPPEPEAAPAPEPEPEPVAEPQPEPEPAPQPEPEPEPAPAPPPPPPPMAQPAPPPAPAPADRYGPVADGQTLWSIADRSRPDPAITINQMMLALQRANPEAFIDDNINQLRRGAVLRIPGSDEARQIDAAEAAALVRAQAEAWRNRRAPVPQPAESVATPSPRPAAPVAAPAAPQGRLEIVPPTADTPASAGQQSGAAAGRGAELRAELAQTREDLAAREVEVEELRSTIAELEAQQADSQRLIEMQSSQLKALQERLAAAQAAAGEAPAAEPAAEAPAAAPSEPVAAEAAPAAAPAPTAAAEPWYLDPRVLGGGGLVLLGGLVLALRSRGRAKPAPVPSRRISDDDALKASLPGNRTAPSAAAAPAPAAAAPAPAEDPAAALRAAVAASPTDLEAHISLLRHLHKQGDRAGFEAAATEMRSHVRSTLDPRWREAVVLGVALSPGNPLFSQAGWNAPRFGDTGVLPTTAAPAPAAPAPAPAAPVAAEDALGDFASLAPAAPATTEDQDEDWDRLARGMTAAAAEPEAPAIPAEPDVEVIDLAEPLAELADEPLPAAAEDAGAEAAVPAEPEPIAFDLVDDAGLAGDEATPAANSADDDASATKIELAKAYLEIGDVDGARGMLEEVVAEAGPAARAEAERLLREIG